MHAATTATANADSMPGPLSLLLLHGERMQRMTNTHRDIFKNFRNGAVRKQGALSTAKAAVNPALHQRCFENVLYNESNTKSYTGMSRMKRVRHQDTCNHNFCPSPLRKFDDDSCGICGTLETLVPP